MKLAIALTAGLLCFGSTASASPVTTLSSEWAADWSAKKLDAVMAMLAPDPVFLPTVGPRWEGTETLRKNFTGLLATYNPHITLRSSVNQISGDLAYDSGTYNEVLVPVKGGKNIPSSGSYLFVYQRQKDGTWKILEQTFTMTTDVKL
jgi:uncharacterized protein (TIGR02246 family)